MNMEPDTPDTEETEAEAVDGEDVTVNAEPAEGTGAGNEVGE